MIGGKIIQVDFDFQDDTVYVVVRDDPPYERDTTKRVLPLTKKTRCIGVGDSIWWQNKIHYWTPQGSARKVIGADYDIRVTGPNT
jgi:hypothetical protein